MPGVAGGLDAVIFGDEEPDIKSKLVVTDPAVFNRTGGLLRDWSSRRRDWTALYDDFKQDWEAGQPDYERRAGEETGFIDKFYNGDFAGYLSNLRSREADARRAAGDRALQFATGQTDRAALARGEPTGTSSATRAMGYRLAKDIENEVGLSDVARERGDLDYMNRSRASYLGVRNNITDAVAKRKLYPHQLNDGELMQAIQELGGIQGVRSGSSQTALWRERPFHERFAAGIDSVTDTFGNLLSAYQGGGYTPMADSTTSASSYMGAPSVANSQPYSVGMSYDAGPPTGGTTFNYSQMNPVAPSGNYNAGMSYNQPAPSGGGGDGDGFSNFGSLAY